MLAVVIWGFQDDGLYQVIRFDFSKYGSVQVRSSLTIS